MKRTLSILLALITLLSALTITTLPATAFAVGGNVGDCTWGFNGDTGRLTISGSGSTGDFKESPPAWYDDYASEVTEVVIGDDVTEIGEGVFYGHSGVRSVTIGSGVRIIGDAAFLDCLLAEVTIPESVEVIGRYAFGYYSEDMYNLEGDVIGKTLSRSDIFIKGKKGSAAEQYAEDNGFTFIEADGEVDFSNINDLSVTITEPEPGEAPDFSADVPAAKGYAVDSEGGVMWFNVSDGDEYIAPGSGYVFEPYKEYRVVITLVTTDDAYAFAPTDRRAALNDMEVGFSDYGWNEDHMVYIESYFVCAPEGGAAIREVEVDTDEPSVGDYPYYYAIIDSDRYRISAGYDDDDEYISGGIGWYNVIENRAMRYTDRFEAGNIYRWSVRLTSNEFPFAPAGEITATLNGRAAQSRRLTDRSIELWYDFVMPGGDVCVLTGSDNWLSVGWTPKIDKYVMTRGAGGIYSITVPDVPATPDGENYALKVVQFRNGDENDAIWHGVDGTDLNYEFRLSAKGDVTVTYDPATAKIAVTGPTVTDPVYTIDYITAVGSGEGSWLNGQSWVPDAAENRMTEVSDGVYEITFEDVPAGADHSVKFAANGSWDVNWGAVSEDTITAGVPQKAAYDGSNIHFEIDETSDVTLRLDLTKMDWIKKTGATFTVTVAPAGFSPDGLIITSTSNFFGKKSVTYTGGVPSQVTVEYYCDTDKYLFINGQYGVNYDPEVLQLNEASNKNGRKLDVFPITGGSGTAFNFNASKYIAKGNFSGLPGFDLVDETGAPIPVVRLVFDVVGRGSTGVELFVEVQSCAPADDPRAYTAYYDKSSSYYTGKNGISDMRNDLTKDGAKIYTVFSPEGSSDDELLGDTDGDREVEIRDATWIQRKVASMDLPFSFVDARADVDGNNEITIMDATYIQRYLANMKVSYKIAQPIS
ncbi:MAG: leucine-rich repeat protein [Ruminococcus sp.]|nr:leucine-rich repeat protein [Ruminococcus sp.]